MYTFIQNVSNHHAFPVVHSRQILLELFAHMEVHVVVFEGAEGFDDYVVPIVDNVLVRLQQGGNFPDGNIYVWSVRGRRQINEEQEKQDILMHLHSLKKKLLHAAEFM